MTSTTTDRGEHRGRPPRRHPPLLHPGVLAGRQGLLGLAGLLAVSGSLAIAAAAGLGATAALGLACCAGLAPAVAWATRHRAGGLPPRTAAALVTEAGRGQQARLLALELAVDRLRSVLESLHEGVVVVDGGGEVVLANPAARYALRDGVASPIGRVLWDALEPDIALIARQVFEELHGAGEGEGEARARSAVPFHGRVVDLTGVRVRSSASGQDFGTVFLFVDASSGHHLAHLKDRFLSSISHELRTPLTNICAYAEILRTLAPGESAEWPEFVRVVHEEGLQLSRLVDNVFDYAQLESGDASFTLIELEGADLARAVVERNRERARELGVGLELEVAADVPRIEADPHRFAQVCSQLLDNALKFTPAGGRVRVSLQPGPAGFRLRVDDSGSGVPGEDRQLVFEKFSQLRDHMTEKPGGAGLGLATCRAIAARLGGKVWCDESPLGGAGFVVDLPAAGARSAVVVAEGAQGWM